MLDVDVVDRRILLAWLLDEQRHPHHVRGGARGDAGAALFAGVKARPWSAVTTRQRAVVQARLAHLLDDGAEQLVGVVGLHQVALVGARDRPGLGRPAAASERSLADRALRVLEPRRQVLPRLVGEQDVKEVRRRPAGGAQGRQEAVQRRRPPDPGGVLLGIGCRDGRLVVGVDRVLFEGGGGVDGRVLGRADLGPQLGRVAGDPAEAALAATGRGPLDGAGPRRAELGDALEHAHVVARTRPAA